MFQLSTRAARKGRPNRTARLRGAASMLAVAAASLTVALAGSAQATCTAPAVTINGPATGTYSGPNYSFDTGSNGFGSFSTCPVSTTVASGTAEIVSGYAGYLGTVTGAGIVPIFNFSGGLDTTGNSPQGGAIVGPLTVAQGATIVLGGQQSIYFGTYAPLNNFLNSAGNVVVEGNGGFAGNSNQWALLGSNTITGNLTLEAGANLRIGEYYNAPATATLGQYTAGGEYAASAITFGPTTNVALQGAAGAGNDALLFLNLSAPAVIGGSLSATANSEVWLHAGTLTVNGADTSANPFVGTLQMDPGTTVVVGDSTHTGAVLGDPGHTDGSTFTLNLNGSAGTVVNLQGYGTVYGTVNNNGAVVTPGGTKGVFGSLTVSQYNQSATGMLQVEVSPGGADRLNVLGTANLSGTLRITVDPGVYGNQVIPILTAGQIKGGFTNIETQGDAAAGLAVTPTSYDVVTELTSATQVYGHLVSAQVDNVNVLTDALYDIQTTSSAHGSGAPRITYSNGFQAWVEPFGTASTITHDGYGYDSHSEGLIGGYEHTMSGNGVAGVALSYANGDLNTDSGKTTSTSNAFNVALYGGFDTPNARIEATVFYGAYSANVARNLGSSGTIDSSPAGRNYGASLQVSNPLYGGLVTPYLRVTYDDIDQEAVLEKGANLLALRVNEIEKGYFDGEFGFKVHPTFAPLPVGLHPEFTLAVQHDFTQNPGETVVGQFANLQGSPFTFHWKGDQGTAGVAGLMLASDISAHFQVYGKVGGRFSADGSEGEFRLGGAYHF